MASLSEGTQAGGSKFREGRHSFSSIVPLASNIYQVLHVCLGWVNGWMKRPRAPHWRRTRGAHQVVQDHCLVNVAREKYGGSRVQPQKELSAYTLIIVLRTISPEEEKKQIKEKEERIPQRL